MRAQGPASGADASGADGRRGEEEGCPGVLTGREGGRLLLLARVRVSWGRSWVVSCALRATCAAVPRHDALPLVALR